MVKEFQKKFVKNFLLLFSASGLSQVILILSTPFLSRLYSPADFGLFSFYVAIVTIISSVSTLKFELAILIPKDERESGMIFILGFSLIILFSLFFGIILPWMLSVEYFNSLEKVWFITIVFPLNIFFLGNYQLIINWLIHKTRYKLISMARITQVIVTVAVSLLLGYLNNTSGLIIGWFLGQIVFFVVLFSFVILKD
ncbi:MAG: oligosaccharide flippase family protein, partial [Leptospiraceae bacterium]|nr:oligosaccharide flippase family protein [Leptospiraceae bacterium]